MKMKIMKIMKMIITRKMKMKIMKMLIKLMKILIILIKLTKIKIMINPMRIKMIVELVIIRIIRKITHLLLAKLN